MTTTMSTVGTATMSDYDGRIVEITVAGVCNQSIKRVSNYTVKVPHNRMSDAMREINSLGGKITGVTVLGNKSTVKESAPSSEPKKAASKAPAKRTAKAPAKKTAAKPRNQRSKRKKS